MTTVAVSGQPGAERRRVRRAGNQSTFRRGVVVLISAFRKTDEKRNDKRK